MSTGAERGSGSVLTLGIITVVLTLFVAVAGASGYVVAAHRARSAADLAALAGAVDFATTADAAAACGAAAVNAEANAVALAGCTVTGDPLDYVVAVEVDRTVARPLPALPSSVSARGFAGTVPP